MTAGTALRQSAARLFRLHGYDVTITRPDDTRGATYDPTTGEMTGASSPLSWTGRGFFADFSTEDLSDRSIKTGDRKLLLQAQGLERAPEINDLVDSEVTIMDVKRVRSGATITHYVCRTRG